MKIEILINNSLFVCEFSFQVNLCTIGILTYMITSANLKEMYTVQVLYNLGPFFNTVCPRFHSNTRAAAPRSMILESRVRIPTIQGQGAGTRLM
jgi:hypothetical protein